MVTSRDLVAGILAVSVIIFGSVGLYTLFRLWVLTHILGMESLVFIWMYILGLCMVAIAIWMSEDEKAIKEMQKQLQELARKR